jgi:hypothetical protein
MPSSKSHGVSHIGFGEGERRRSGWPWLALGVLLFSVRPVGAQICDQPVTVTPAAPTTQTPVTLAFLGYTPAESTLIHAVSGNVVLIEHHWDSLFLPGYEQRQVSLGLLPAGTYQVRVVASLNDPNTFVACGSFSVSAAASEGIPVLSPPLLVALSAILALVGVVTITSGEG